MNTPRTEMDGMGRALGEFHRISYKDWHEVAMSMPLDASEYANGYQAAINFVTQRLNVGAELPTLAALVADGGWLPIESAPMRGKFLVFGGDWVGEAKDENPRQKADITMVNRSWRSKFYVADAEEFWPWIENPTHWRPLAPTPAAIDAARAGGCRE